MNDSLIITNLKYVLFGVIFCFSMNSCTEFQENLKSVPTAFGKIGGVTVIADQQMWDSEVGDTLRYYYESAYLILPQPEAIFDLTHYTVEEIMKEPTRKEMRNYVILANLADENSPATRLVMEDIGSEKARRAQEDPTYNSMVGRNKWARGQILIYQFAYSDDALIENIKRNFTAVAKKIYEVEEERIDATLFVDGENRKLMEEVQGDLGVQMRIPKSYFLALNDDEVIWIRKETQKYSSNIMLKRMPYTDQSQLTREHIKAVTDSLGKYVSSQIPNTYVVVNDVDLPMFVDAKTINNNYALEARGIWEMENDFMGGPFISYLIHNPEKNELLLAEGFVYAPGEDKRNYMRYLEYLISTIRF